MLFLKRKFYKTFSILLTTLCLAWAMPSYAIDDLGDTSNPNTNADTAPTLPQQIIPILENTTYLYYYESDDALFTTQRTKRYSFSTLPDDKITLLVYGLDNQIMPRLALYNADGELIREGTSPLTPYVTGLEFTANDKELFFFEVTALNNARGVVRAMLFEGEPFSDDLTLVDIINPLLPGRAFLVAGDHIDPAIDGLDVRVEVLPVPRFDDQRPEVFASRGTDVEYPPQEERFTPRVQRGWKNTSDIEIYTINVRAAPEPLADTRMMIDYNKSLNLNTFFYFEYHLIIGKGSVPQLLVRGDECQLNPNRPECIPTSTAPNIPIADAAPPAVPITIAPPPPPIEVFVFALPLENILGAILEEFVYVPPTVTFDCFLADPINDINYINGTNGNDILGGTGCRDEINGGDGNDSIDGGINADVMFGGDGDDYFFDNDFYEDVYFGGDGVDTLEYNPFSSNYFYCYYYNHPVFGFTQRCEGGGYAGVVNYNGGGNGTAFVSNYYNYTDYDIFGNILDAGGTSSDIEVNTFSEMENIITAGSGNETFNILPDTLDNIFDAGAGNDTVSYAGYFGAVDFDITGTTIITFNGTDTDTLENFENYIGSNGVDTLDITNTNGISLLNYNTGASDDIITIANVGAQAVTVNGGVGDDIFTVQIVDANVDTFIGGGGIDSLIYDSTNPVPPVPLPPIPALYVDYNAGGNGAVYNNVAGTPGTLLDTFQIIDNVTTSNATDYFSIEFDGISNTFTGSAVPNFNDSDTADYSVTNTSITFTLNTAGSVTADQGGGITDTLVSFETLIGSSADDTFNITNASFFNDALGDGIQGGGGDDTFNVTADGIGASLFDGGAGLADELVVNAGATDVTIDYDITSYSNVTVGIETDFARNFENITTAAGNDAFNITPDAVDNIFNAAGGNDTYTVAGNTGVAVNIGAGDPTVVGGGGTDILQNFENIVGGSGNDIFNIDVTSGQVIHLNGGLGTNQFVFTGNGAAGDAEIHIHTTPGGIDWFDFSAITGAGIANIDMGYIDNPILFGLDDQILFGNFRIILHNAIQNLIGTNQADNITGSGLDDQIGGLGGNDTINAGNGNDIVDGGAGNDTINGGNGNDIIYGGLGNDTLHGDDISGATTGNDIVYGGVACGGLAAGNPAIAIVPANSMDGNDTILGGTGNDILYGGNNNSAETNAHDCDDGSDSVSDLNNGDADIVYGGNNNTGGGSGNDGADTLVSVDESGNGAEDTAFAGNNNTGGGTGTDAAGDVALGDPGDILGNDNNPP